MYCQSLLFVFPTESGLRSNARGIRCKPYYLVPPGGIVPYYPLRVFLVQLPRTNPYSHALGASLNIPVNKNQLFSFRNFCTYPIQKRFQAIPFVYTHALSGGKVWKSTAKPNLCQKTLQLYTIGSKSYDHLFTLRHVGDVWYCPRCGWIFTLSRRKFALKSTSQISV